MSGKTSDLTAQSMAGRCLCGAVAFTVARGSARGTSACHCSQCRKWSGHYWASITVASADLVFAGGAAPAALAWYRASADARRGFCTSCGASLFWQADRLDGHKDRIAVALGALEGPTGLALDEHIFVADKGDYYLIADGLPQLASE